MTGTIVRRIYCAADTLLLISASGRVDVFVREVSKFLVSRDAGAERESSDGEFSTGIEMPSFEEELIRPIGGRDHVRFGHTYSFAAGYVCILLAALAGICLARLGSRVHRQHYGC